jgi:hypothetical protein
MRVAGGKEGKGSKVMGIVKRMAGEWTEMATKRVMAMVTRVVGKQWRQQQRGQ